MLAEHGLRQRASSPVISGRKTQPICLTNLSATPRGVVNVCTNNLPSLRNGGREGGREGGTAGKRRAAVQESIRNWTFKPSGVRPFKILSTIFSKISRVWLCGLSHLIL